MFGIDLLIAFVLDYIFGDPRWFPHPVRGIGFVIAKTEAFARKTITNERLAGTLTGLVSIIITIAVVWGSIAYASLFGEFWKHVVSILWLYFGISTRDLCKAVMEVYTELKKSNMIRARFALSMIVSRNTKEMDETAISRAAIETVVENTVDGIISPLFFAMLGGPVAMWAFKAISTGDSMLGYKNKKYQYFGTFAARLDDVANWIPARLMFILFPISALFLKLNPWQCLKVALRDRKIHSSPNAGIPEAAAAGALEVSLGGPAVYHGKQHNKPYFGPEFPAPDQNHILKAIRLMWTSSFIMLGVAVIYTFL